MGAERESGHDVVTGGAGFLGSNLVRRLLQLRRRVVVVDAMVPGSGASPANLADVTDELSGWVEADLADPSGWEQTLVGVNVVFHLAAQTSHVAGMQDPAGDLRANTIATL